MSLLFMILMMISCLLLGLIVLIQNPKGGGLSGNIAGFSNQFMGVKQTTDVLEKGTWIMAGVVALFCILSPLLMREGAKADDNLIKGINPNTTNSAPVKPSTPMPAPMK
ncbi:MAG: preprotein translocase subunit SecG [Chitinophagia bacterium]|nr:preprotein translocase subunit SecG [Chitinophagia bacterium]